MMTVGTILVSEKGEVKVKKLPAEESEKMKFLRKKRKRLCLMNIIAIICIVSLLSVVILKFLMSFYFKTSWCGTLNPTFTIKGNTFMRDGKPFQYISGSIHYSRVPRIYWRDRLRKMKEAGLDAIQTYVPWNFHQPMPDAPSDWEGDRDLVEFVKTAHEENLLVILRAGPYICAEWDFGGLPAWLLQKNASMVIRSSDPQYMKYMVRWMSELLMKMRPLLYQVGGPIIMVQLENEYGSYPTCDKKYISSLYDLGRKTLGPDVILFTTDGNSAGDLKCGAIDRRFFTTVDFGTGSANNPQSAFSALRAIRPTGPLVNSEYYVGWLDTWGGTHAHVAVGPVLQGLSAMYRFGASINMYMFFGGTNFAFWNGAEDPKFDPQVTSYDYDAPLSEAGDMTWKYQQLRSLIHKLKGKPLKNVTTTNATALAYGTLQMKPMCHFVSLLPKYRPSNAGGKPLASMETHGVYQGYAVYSTFINLTVGSHQLVLPVVKDRAFVFTSDINYRRVNYHGVVIRDGPTNSVSVTSTSNSVYFLHILVENEGHINFNSHMFGDTKGIFGNVSLDKHILRSWQFYHLDITADLYQPNGCDLIGKPSQGMFFGVDGVLQFLKGPSDTFFMPTSFRKGQLMMNSDDKSRWMNVGRYWPSKGPQKSLFVPRTFVRLGTNRISLFELEGVDGVCPGDCVIQFISKPVLGRSETLLTQRRH